MTKKRTGKYDRVLKGLPRLLPADATWLEKVEKVKAEIVKGLDDRARSIQEIKGRLLEAEQDVERIKAELATAESSVAGFDSDEETVAMPVTASMLAAAFLSVRMRKDALTETESRLNIEEEALRQLLVDQLENEGLRGVDLAVGAKLSLQPEPYASVEDRDAFRAFCLADPNLRSGLQLPWQTLNSFVKQRLLDGVPEPPGVKVWQKDKIVLRWN